MTPDSIILLILEQAGGSLRGKTLLQKRAYFISVFLNLDLGFSPHFYGPYSAQIENGISECKSLGFILERDTSFGISDNDGFEIRRYDYFLSMDGQQVVHYIKQQNPDCYKKIFECLTKLTQAGEIASDYINLSVAAKIFYILKEENKPLDKKAIQQTAEKLGWKISPDASEKAAKFLTDLQLVKPTLKSPAAY